MKNISGDPDFMAGSANRLLLGGKQFITAAQQTQLVATAESGVWQGMPGQDRIWILQCIHAKPSSATSGRWSDILAQEGPFGTCMDKQRRPRI